MALVVKTDWKMQDIVTPDHVNRIEGNIKTLETDLTSGLSGKVDKVTGKGLSTLDFTTALRDKINTSETKIAVLESNKLNVADYTKTSILSKLGTEEVNLNVSKLQGKSASDFLAVDGKAEDSALLNGATESTASTGNTIVKRTVAGNIVAFKFQEGTQLLENKYASKSTTDGHISSTNNPHSVTKAQVGLNFVENLPVATSAEIIQGTIKKYVTSDELSVALDEMTVGTAKESVNSATLNNKEETSSSTPNTIVSRDVSGNISAVEFLEGNTKLSEKYLGINATAVDSDKLDGKDSTAFATAGHNHDTKYLGKTAKAADSAQLGGHSDDSYMTYLPKQLLSTYNLNNLLTPGHYTHGGSPALANSPAGTEGTYCHLIVIGRSTSSQITQIYIDAYSGIYSRVYVGGWGNWTTLTGALYGTGSPPSSLAPGQIYVQY